MVVPDKHLTRPHRAEPAYNRRMKSRGQQINLVSSVALIALSFIALLAVLSGYARPPQPDEGIAAHIFQLSVVALAPVVPLFVATSEWKRSLRGLVPLGIAAAVLMTAFSALYYLEHYFYSQHYR